MKKKDKKKKKKATHTNKNINDTNNPPAPSGAHGCGDVLNQSAISSSCYLLSIFYPAILLSRHPAILLSCYPVICSVSFNKNQIGANFTTQKMVLLNLPVLLSPA